jgi:hypothetical protein
MSERKSIVDDVWSSAIGGLDWLKSVLFGEFADNRPLSVVIADMLVSFVPGVVIVTSARDAVAVIVRLAQHPEKRDDTMEWIVLAACMITLALPLAMAAGGAVAAGIGAVVGGIAGSELGAALRAVMLLLIKEAAKLGDVIRFLQKFVKGDVIGFLRAIRFRIYEKALLQAFEKTVNKLIEICRGLRAHLEHFKYFSEAQRAIATLSEWERKFYDVQAAAIKQLPVALVELDARLAKLLAQVAPKESHTAIPAVKAARPEKVEIVAQHINDTAGKPLKSANSENSGSGARNVAAQSKASNTSEKNGGASGGGNSGAPPRKDLPDPPEKPKEGPNSKRQEVLADDFAAVYAKAPAAKVEIDALADEIAARYGGRVAKAPIKSEKRAMEKIINDYEGDPTRIKDLARNTIIVPSEKIDDVVRDLKEAGAAVKRIDPETDPFGYSGVNSNLKTRSGLIAEIQVNSPEMIYAKESEGLARGILGNDAYEEIARKVTVPGGQGHLLYEMGRSLPAESERLSQIEAESRSYYESIRRLANGN